MLDVASVGEQLRLQLALRNGRVNARLALDTQIIPDKIGDNNDQQNSEHRYPQPPVHAKC